MKNYFFSLVLAAGMWNAGSAQGPMRLSLAEAQEYAIQHSYNVQLSDLDLEIAKRKVKETTAIGLPQVNASGGFQNFLDIPVTVIPDFISPTVLNTLLQTGVITPGDIPQSDPQFVEAQFGTKFTMTAGVTASQLLFDGSYIVGLQAAKSYVQFAELNKEKSEADVKEQVAQAYFTVLVSEENLSILQKSVGTLEKTLSDTRIMFENGFMEEQDVDQLKLQLNSLNNQLDYAESQKNIAYYFFLFTLGLPESTEVSLTDNVTSLVDEADHGALLNEAFDVEKNPNYKVINSALGLSLLNEKLEKSAYLPKLSASFSHQQQALRSEFNFTDSDKDWFPSTILGLSLNIPIWSSGMRSNRIQQAKLDVEKTKVSREQVMDATRLEYRTAYSEFLNALNGYNNAKESMDLSRSILERTQIKFREGISGSFDLSQAQNQNLNSQGAYIGSMLQLLNAKIRLKKALNQF
jgi:outer membrane protein